MKTTSILRLLSAVLLITVSVLPMAAQTLNKEAVAFVKTYQDAYNKGNMPALMTLYSDKVGWVNRDGSVTANTKADVEADYVRDFGETAGSYMDFTVVGTEAEADGKVKVNTTVSGYDFDRKTGTKIQPTAGTYQAIIAKEGGQWKIGQVKWAMNLVALEMRDFIKKFQDALNREDAAALKSMLTATATRAVADGTSVTGADQIMDVYAKRFADADLTAVITLANVIPQFDGSVICTGTSRSSGRSVKGNRVVLDLAYNNTVVKENGAWKMSRMKLTGLTKVMIYHKVADYAAWKKGFDMFFNERSMAGELSAEVGTLQDDPGTVYVINEWASPEAAQSFYARPELAAAMQKAGVTGKPTMLILSKK